MFLYTPMPPVVTVMAFIYCLEPVTAALASQAPEGNKNVCTENLFMATFFFFFAVSLNTQHNILLNLSQVGMAQISCALNKKNDLNCDNGEY